MQQSKTYSKKQLLEILQITDKYWYNHKTQIIDYLKSICDNLQEEGNRKDPYYTLVNQYEDFIPIKNDIRNIRRTQKEIEYPKVIKKVIRKEPLQNYTNLAKITQKYKSIQKLHYTETTHYQYIRKFTQKMFGKVLDNQGGTAGIILNRVWCRYDEKNLKFIEMDSEDLELFFKLTDESKKETKKDIKGIHNLYEKGEITKEEHDSAIGDISFAAYQIGKANFIAIKKYEPWYIPQYAVGMNFTISEEEWEWE